MVASVAGTSGWQYNPGAYPTPTGVVPASVQPWFDGGDGSEANPFRIATKAHLANVSAIANHGWSFYGQYLVQSADIALNAPMEQWGEQMPEQWDPIARCMNRGQSNLNYYFRGSYDGAFHHVSNMYVDVNNDDIDFVALFGALGDGAVIKRLLVTDAYVNNAKRDAAILAGATKIHNDMFSGDIHISQCFTSGESSGSAFICHNAAEKLELVACGSTASARQIFIANEYASSGRLYPYGCWFGGTLPQSEGYVDAPWLSGAFNFIDVTKNPIVPGANTNMIKVTTEYMCGREFVNDLNLGASLIYGTGGWNAVAGAYPAFTGGEEPGVDVNLVDGVNEPMTFKAFVNTSFMRPVVADREGYILSGWTTDEGFSDLFIFGTDKIQGPTDLYARWRQHIVPDYTPFANKFAKTFTVTTPEQLYGLADIVNGKAGDIERTDFAGKTIKIGNDIVLNDPAEYEYWGSSVTPATFPGIGIESTAPFQGIIDGQGHAVVGMSQCDNYYGEATAWSKGFVPYQELIQPFRICCWKKLLSAWITTSIMRDFSHAT